tara:strand:- start:435 stop:2927 length:2493 start_codon:yes stop_codon:yes gene_type:complete
VNQHRDNEKQAYTALGTIDDITQDGANKDSLDLSTRTNALGAQAAYLGTAAPDAATELMPELMEGAGALMGSSGSGSMSKLGGLFKGKGTSTPSTGDIGVEDGIKMGDAMGRYGGSPNKRIYKHGGHMVEESGMDLKNLNRLENGGALNLRPGAGSGLSPLGNPYSPEALMASTGTDSLSAGGPTNENYEAEGGEAIMHETDGAPATSGNLNEITENLSMLEGASHDNGGEEVSGAGEQYVFSTKLKSDTWKKTFAEAAETIGKNIEKYETLSDGKESDEITVSTANAMIQSWQQKLVDLQQEQETARQEKFMGMMESGAGPEELSQAFPDLYESFMAEQQMQEQAQMQQGQQGQGGMEQEAQMAANPMGNIDMAALSAEDQALVGAKYGLPQKKYGDDEAFTPFNFNDYMKQSSGFVLGEDDQTFTLDKNYMGEKSQLMDELTLNYPDGGYEVGVGDEIVNIDSPQGMYDHLSSDFSDWRNRQLKENYSTSTEKVNKADFTNAEGVVDTEAFNKAQATQKYYNSGIPTNWESDYGANAGQGDKQYFGNLKKQLLSDGKSENEVKSILNREKLKRSNDLDLLKSKSEETVELTDAEKAEQQIAKLQREKQNEEMFGKLGQDIQNLAPSLYNMSMGNKDISRQQYVGNKYEDNILDNISKLGNTDISQELDTTEQSFNMMKYAARNASDGSSGGMMNTLLRAQNFKDSADRTTYLNKRKADTAGLVAGNEALYKLGENERTERMGMADSDLQSEAAKQAFTAKGWEGLSGYGQLQQKMANSASRDEQLRGLLDDIYPDVEMYMNRNGEMDIEKILGENPELIEYFKKTYKF